MFARSGRCCKMLLNFETSAGFFCRSQKVLWNATFSRQTCLAHCPVDLTPLLTSWSCTVCGMLSRQRSGEDWAINSCIPKTEKQRNGKFDLEFDAIGPKAEILTRNSALGAKSKSCSLRYPALPRMRTLSAQRWRWGGGGLKYEHKYRTRRAGCDIQKNHPRSIIHVLQSSSGWSFVIIIHHHHQ